MSDIWDIIVVGAGTAGIPCAIAAAEAGARVVVLEKSAEVGGTLHLTGGHMSAGGTRRQRARGIDDSPAQHLADVLRISRNSVDETLTRVAVEEAPHTIDWLDSLGFEFDPATPRILFGHESYSIPRTYFGLDAGKSVLAVLLPLWERLIAEGRITLLLEHALTDLLTEDGAVTGVELRGPAGASSLRGKAVVLACGGYGSNAEFFAAVTPQAARLVSTARPAATGDGIRAAMKLGARFRDAEKHLATLGGIETVPGSGRCDWQGVWANVYSPVYRAPLEIYVNERGARFINEDEPSPDKREHAVFAQPGQRFWIVFDDAAIDAGPPLVRPWDGAALRERARAGAYAWVAADVETLARKAGIDPTGLAQSVAECNEAVRTGRDALGRTKLDHGVAQPPFYAVLTCLAVLVTFGGLAVDGELRVVNEQGAPIPGLYAVGETLGLGSTSGQAFCSGMMLTPAISFGRLVGRRLAQGYLPGAGSRKMAGRKINPNQP